MPLMLRTVDPAQPRRVQTRIALPGTQHMTHIAYLASPSTALVRTRHGRTSRYRVHTLCRGLLCTSPPRRSPPHMCCRPHIRDSKKRYRESSPGAHRDTRRRSRKYGLRWPWEPAPEIPAPQDRASATDIFGLTTPSATVLQTRWPCMPRRYCKHEPTLGFPLKERIFRQCIPCAPHTLCRWWWSLKR
jgi:hypothetical protein